MKKSITILSIFAFLVFVAGCSHRENGLGNGSLKWNPEGNFQYLDSSMALDISGSVFTVSYSGTPGFATSLKGYVSFSATEESDSEAQAVAKKIKVTADKAALKILVDTRQAAVSDIVFLKMKIADDFSENEVKVSISNTGSKSGKKKTAVLSDIHLTDKRAAYYGYIPLKENKTKLLSYLSYLKENASAYKELVLLGDVIDEFTTGLYNPKNSAQKISLFAKLDGTPVSQFEYEQMIAAYNEEVISAIKAVGEAGVQLVYLPGNHDQYVTAESITKIFGENIRQVRDEENPLLGLYSPEVFPNAVLEHGSRYDVINALDPVSLEGMIALEGETPSLSIGYFLTRGIAQIRMPTLASTISLLQSLMGGNLVPNKQKLEDRLHAVQDSIADPDERNYNLYITFIKDYIGGITKTTIGKMVDGIDTGIGGIEGTYSVADLLPALGSGDPEGVYYKKLTNQKAWEERLRYNKVPETLPFIDGLIGPATDYGMIRVMNHVFGDDLDHNIFIMGHTHRPSLFVRKVEGSDRSFIYANSGAWVDISEKHEDGTPYRQCTFIELYEDEGNQQISLKYIDEDYSIKNMEFPVWVLN